MAVSLLSDARIRQKFSGDLQTGESTIVARAAQLSEIDAQWSRLEPPMYGNLTPHFWIGLVRRAMRAACVLLPATVLLAQETVALAGARLFCTVGRSEISAGEAVDVIVQFENLGANELVLETGDNGVGNFAWTVIGPDGTVNEYRYHPPSGEIGTSGMPVPGRQTVRLQFILDERTPFRAPGRYMITMRHLPNGAEGSLSLLVGPRDEQKLRDRCRRIVSDLKEARSSAGPRRTPRWCRWPGSTPPKPSRRCSTSWTGRRAQPTIRRGR